MAVQFEIVEDQDKDHFEKAVKEKLTSGWSLHGEMKAFPFMFRSDGDVDQIIYIQAVVKVNEDTEGPVFSAH